MMTTMMVISNKGKMEHGWVGGPLPHLTISCEVVVNEGPRRNKE
jgi:hypothetical protein